MKQMIRGFIFVLMFLHIAVAYSSAGDAIPDVIAKMRESNSKIHDMRCLFIKNVVKKGKKIPETRMEFKFMKDPEMIFVNFLNRHEGRKCLYVKGKNKGKMVVRLEGMMKFLKLKLDPLGKKAMSEDIDPMTVMGFGHLIESIDQWYAQSLTDTSVNAIFLKDQPLDNGIFHMIEISSDSADNGYLILYVDRESYLPYKLSYKRDNNVATYVYKALETNINLASEDFTI